MRAEPLASRLAAQTVLEHERRLPEPGEVLVPVGAWVKSEDVVARAARPGQLRLVDAADALGIVRSQLPRYLRIGVGQDVEAGEVLAAGGFMGWRTVRAPVAGRVAEVTAGRIFIQESQRVIELRALLPGQVVRVVPQRGVAIRAMVSRVVGIWGSGGEQYGPLVLRSSGPTDPVNWISVDLTCCGRIVVGGQCLDKRVLLRAARFRALGLIVGGLAEHLRAKAEEFGLTVVVTDGLGAVSMAGPVFELLAKHEGKEGLLNGGQGGRGAGLPSLSIPLTVIQGPVNVAPERSLATGDRVRVTRPPYLGATGWVRAVLEQDGETWVKVSLEQGPTTLMAYRNLERLQ